MPAPETAEPIAFRTTRYRCPHCPRTGSSKARVRDHIGRCWSNPAARGCKTCTHYQEASEACGCEPGCNWGGPEGGYPERCAAGISLAGRPQCGTCNGVGQTYSHGDFGGVSECSDCGGDGDAVKPGPIVGCHAWEGEVS